jgi:thiol:disulfide interchange protein DsbD
MKKVLLLLTLFFITFIAINAQDKHIKLEVSAEKTVLKSGEETKLLVWMTMEEHWYTYALSPQLNSEGIGPQATEFSIKPDGAFDKIAKIFAQKPKSKKDEGFQMDILHYKGKAYFIINVKALKDIDFGKDKIEIIAYLQQCDETKCLPGEEFTATISKEPATISEDLLKSAIEYNITYDESGYPVATSKTEIKAETDTKTSEKEEIKEAKSGGSIWSMIARALVNGILSIFMPCVFPMIPITVSFFTKRSETAKGKGKGMRDAIAYALGIVGSFTIFGLLVSGIFGAAGMQDLVSSPWFNFFVVGIFLFFGLSLLGAYEIQVPTKLTNKIDTKSRNTSGLTSVFLMSATFALASFSCTGPFIADSLVAAANGSWFYPMIAMMCFSAALAFPFFFLALFPAALNKMPSAGAWMNNIKIVLGFVVLAIATKYLNNALQIWGMDLSRGLVLSIYTACALLITLYILGVFKTKMDAPVERVGTLRLLFAVTFATVTIYIFSGFFGGSLGFLEGMLPARTITETTTTGGQNAEWLHNYDEAIAKAKEEGKNVFLDFTGMNCTNCKKMDGDMFPRPAVQEGLSKMVAVKLYTDKRNDPESERYKKMQIDVYGTVALPTYIIITPEGKELGRISYTNSESEFLEFLAKGAK